jgi:hypothetical protein
MDRWELLLDLPGHHADVQSLVISQYGDFVVTGEATHHQHTRDTVVYVVGRYCPLA